PHVERVRSQIGRSEKPIRADLSFDAEVPLVDVCCFGVVIQIAEESIGNIQSALTQTCREGIPTRITGIRIIKTCHRIVEGDSSGPWRGESHADDDRIAGNEIE